jgi:hypothetical protein
VQLALSCDAAVAPSLGSAHKRGSVAMEATAKTVANKSMFRIRMTKVFRFRRTDRAAENYRFCGPLKSVPGVFVQN